MNLGMYQSVRDLYSHHSWKSLMQKICRDMEECPMRDITGQEITGWLCVLGAAPFAACGFFKYHGMTAEQFLWAVIKSELLYPKKLVFQSEDIYYSCMQETISLGEKNQKDGAEIIKEREQKAEAKQRKKRKGRSDAFD